MNATPSVSQTPLASDPAQQGSAAAANSVKSGANAQDFAAALSNAGPKPTRKAAGHRPADTGAVGGHLPAPGNLSPPPASPAGSVAPSAAAAIPAPAAGAVISGGPFNVAVKSYGRAPGHS